MIELERKIGYQFKNNEHLNIALTHSSYSNEVGKSVECNERLEFLGDSVLSLVVTNYIFLNFSQFPEGDLTSSIPCL